MTTEYIVWIQIEECEMDEDDYDTIATVGEPRQAGRFKTERLAHEHVEHLLDRDAVEPVRQSRCPQERRCESRRMARGN